MKELTIKEKAKAYDYAVNKAKELILNENGVVRVDKPLFDELFPSEMEESEDEKIRKGLIKYFKDFRLGTFAYLEPKKILAWLEKQGEHSVSPLFTFEDVLTIQCAMAYAKFQDRELNVALKKLHDKVYDAYHDSKNHHIESQDGLKGEQIPANSAKTCKDEQKPYGKREECYDCQMNYGGTCKGSCAMKRGEQKPADKVEHKRMTKLEDKLSSLVVNAVHIYCKENELDTPHYVGLILGDRLAKEWSQDILTLAKDELKMTEQKPAEWDNNDEYIFNTILHTLDLKKCKFEKEGNSEEAERWHTYYNWMKPLKNRILPQPQQGWSEEDNFMYNKIKNLLTDISLAPESIKSLFDWLKDLRDRVQPQTTWKPSDEQLYTLEKATHIVGSKYKSCLASLYQELKKLREE